MDHSSRTSWERKHRWVRWQHFDLWSVTLQATQVNPLRPTHLGRAYSSDPMGDAVDPPTNFPDSISRRLTPEDMDQSPGWSVCTGCRIGTWNIAGGLACRDIEDYLHVMLSTETDIMVLVDTGMVATAAHAFDRRLAAYNRNNQSHLTQYSCYARAPNKRTPASHVIGGITVLVREKWRTMYRCFKPTQRTLGPCTSSSSPPPGGPSKS
jgi:hypothetical protein